MEGAEEICAALGDRSFSAIGLVLNERGLDRAMGCDLDEVNFVAYAADGYATKNTGATADRRNEEAAGLVARATQSGLATTVTISVSFGDPVDGAVDPQRVADIAHKMTEAGADEIVLADTIGVAVPPDVRARIAAVRAAAPDGRLRCHFHNPRNTGYVNLVAAIDAGVDVLDTSVGGYGGSPFSPGAGGNVASEDVVAMLDRMQLGTGIDATALAEIGTWLAGELGDEQPPAMTGRVPAWP